MPKLVSLAALAAAAFALTLAADPPGDANAGKKLFVGTLSSATCETSSWGTAGAGGIQTYCVDPDTGQTTWEIAEWGDGTVDREAER